MSADAEDARQQQSAEKGKGGETRIVGRDTNGDGAPHCDEPEDGSSWSEVHGDLLVTPVDTNITIALTCGDGVNGIRRSSDEAGRRAVQAKGWPAYELIPLAMY
jgi:hypothetical protein